MIEQKHINIRHVVVTLALLGAILSCSDDSTEPGAGYSLSGYVVLTGTVRDAVGLPLGDLTRADVSGVVVHLFRGRDRIAQTSTVNGRYSFGGLSAGDYRVFTWITPVSGDSTSVLTVVDRNLEVADTLFLLSMGSLAASPNPADSRISLYYVQAEMGLAALDILRPDSTLVANLLDPLQVVMPGQRVTTWDGSDADSVLVVPGAYWAVYSSQGTYKNELVVRE